MVTVLTEVEKKAVDEIFEAVKEDNMRAYVAMLFLNSKQKAYLMIKMAIAKSKETHDEA